MSARVWGLLLFLSVLWGGSFLFVGIAVAELPPVTLVFVRVVVAAAVLAAALRAGGLVFPTDRASLVDLTVMGILNNVVPFVLIVWAQKTVPAGLASIFNATTPIFAVVLTHLLTDEKATATKLAGVVLGLVGVAVLVGFDRLDGFDGALAAKAALLGAALAYGLSSVWARRLRGRPAMVTATGQLVASSALLLPIMLVVDAPWTLAPPSWPVVAAVAALAILSTALAYVVFFRIIVLSGPTSAMLVTLLVPASAVLLGAVFLGERLAPQHFAGMAVIATGLLAIDGRLPRAVLRRFGRA